MINAVRLVESPFDVDLDKVTFDINGQAAPYRYLGVYPCLATVCGQPATVFLAGKPHLGLPTSLQVTGPYLEDLTTIQFTALVSEQIGGFTPLGYAQPIDVENFASFSSWRCII